MDKTNTSSEWEHWTAVHHFKVWVPTESSLLGVTVGEPQKDPNLRQCVRTRNSMKPKRNKQECFVDHQTTNAIRNVGWKCHVRRHRKIHQNRETHTAKVQRETGEAVLHAI